MKKLFKQLWTLPFIDINVCFNKNYRLSMTSMLIPLVMNSLNSGQARRTTHFASQPVMLSALRYCHPLSLQSSAALPSSLPNSVPSIITLSWYSSISGISWTFSSILRMELPILTSKSCGSCIQIGVRPEGNWSSGNSWSSTIERWLFWATSLTKYRYKFLK